jgi:hypothetical protein
MTVHPRPRSRSPKVTLFSVVVLLAWGVMPSRCVQAGEPGRTRSTRTTVWSTSGASPKAIRTEMRRESSGGYHVSSTVADREQDESAEVDAYLLSRDHGHWRNGSGSERDWEEAEDARDGAGGDMFWFRRGGDRYLVTDPDMIRQLAELFAPQEDLGRRQGELGRRQGELGRLQGELGRKQGELGRIQARLGLRQAALARERASRDRRDLDSDDLEGELATVSRRQDEVGELQSELGAQQSALGEKQSALGERQAALGREQERVAKEIAQALGARTREAIANGVARRIDR